MSGSGSDLNVTIGICVKNSERTIRECLKSILSQDYPRGLMEIIVVDGGSADRTTDIAREMISGSGIFVRFLCDNGKGLGTARQMVLDNTRNKYVLWVDGDVVISKNFVREQVNFMERKPKVGVATGNYIYRENEQETLASLLQSLSKYVGSTEFKDTNKYRGLPPNDASIYRVDASTQAGGFDMNIRGASEDEDLIVRIMEKGWSLSVNKEAGFIASPRQTWQSLWLERSWFGRGKHFLAHKHRNVRMRTPSIPLVYFVMGLKEGSKVYRLTAKKKSFLLSLYYVFVALASWYGFVAAHMEGYGHE